MIIQKNNKKDLNSERRAGIILSVLLAVFILQAMTGLPSYALGSLIMKISDLVFELSMFMLKFGHYLRML